jgi:hypothetical protein
MVGVMIVGIAISVGIIIFGSQSVDANEVAIITELTSLAKISSESRSARQATIDLNC